MGIVLGIFKSVISLIKYPLMIIMIMMVMFYMLVAIQTIRLRKKGYKFKKGQHNKLKKIPMWKKLFVLLPKQVALDNFNRNPEDFRHKGIVIFTGRQGYGKTIAMVKEIMDMQSEYPKCKVITNLGYKKENDTLKHWKQLTDYKNGVQGVVVGMDELQNWFSSKQSANFPPEMLSIVTQNRKNKRIILGTAQNFYMLSKDIRTQCTEVRECYTILNALTIVRKKEPICDNTGEVKKWKNRGMYFFVHDKELRENYDTYKVIDGLSKSGFKDISSQVAK